MPEEERIKLLQRAVELAESAATMLNELYIKHCKAVEERR